MANKAKNKATLKKQSIATLKYRAANKLVQVNALVSAELKQQLDDYLVKNDMPLKDFIASALQVFLEE